MGRRTAAGQMHEVRPKGLWPSAKLFAGAHCEAEDVVGLERLIVLDRIGRGLVMEIQLLKFCAMRFACGLMVFRQKMVLQSAQIYSIGGTCLTGPRKNWRTAMRIVHYGSSKIS